MENCNFSPLFDFDGHCEVVESGNMHEDEYEIEDDEVQHISMVDELEKKLAVGTVMSNMNEAYLLYCKYAKTKGFGVIEGDQRYFAHTNEVQSKEYECWGQGPEDEKASNNKVPVYQKPVTGISCKAKLTISREKRGDVWRVSKFFREHNHEMVLAKQTHLVRSACSVSHAKSSTLGGRINVGIPVTSVVSFIENKARDSQSLGFIREDAYNHIAPQRHTKIENRDANTLVQYFANKSNQEIDFYWSIQLDDDDRIMNLFFRDYRCAVDYECFGDVFSINTTYRTNKYNLICAPFVGINQHMKNVMFGMAFMSDETESSFEWLFKTFIDSMNGKQPQVIFFDQCQTMKNTIEAIFPHATLRSEATNRVLKDVGKKTFTLSEFVWSYENIQIRWREAEMNENTRSQGLAARILKHNPLLSHAAKLYTLNVYNTFEFQFLQSMNIVFVEKLDLGNGRFEFKVRSHDEDSKVWQVVFDMQSHEVKCSCHFFETIGILCRHALRVYNYMNVTMLPKSCILPRWLKNNERVTDKVDKKGTGRGYESGLVFINQTVRTAHDLACLYESHKEARSRLTGLLDGAQKQLSTLVKNLSVEDGSNDVEVEEDNDELDKFVICNPPTAKGKGTTGNRTTHHWYGNIKKWKGKGKAETSSTRGSKRKVQTSVD